MTVPCIVAAMLQAPPPNSASFCTTLNLKYTNVAGCDRESHYSPHPTPSVRQDGGHSSILPSPWKDSLDRFGWSCRTRLTFFFEMPFACTCWNSPQSSRFGSQNSSLVSIPCIWILYWILFSISIWSDFPYLVLMLLFLIFNFECVCFSVWSLQRFHLYRWSD